MSALFIIFFGILNLLDGDFKFLLSQTFISTIILSALYAGSVLFLCKAEKREKKFRLKAWAISILFHTGMLTYLYFGLNLYEFTFIIGMVEVGILILSSIGFIYCVNSKDKKKLTF